MRLPQQAEGPFFAKRVGMQAVNRLKISAREIKNGRPGRRFEDHYERRRGDQQGPHRRFGRVAIGLALIAAGIALGVAPLVPGVVLIALGAGVIASGSRAAARALDRTELAARRLWQRLKRGR